MNSSCEIKVLFLFTGKYPDPAKKRQGTVYLIYSVNVLDEVIKATISFFYQRKHKNTHLISLLFTVRQAFLSLLSVIFELSHTKRLDACVNRHIYVFPISLKNKYK